MLPSRPAFALSIFLMVAAGAAWAPPLRAQEQAEDQDPGESADRYAQVKAVEGDVVVHRGETDDALSRGLPIAEGDVLESHGRGALQLGDGSVVAFGAETRFRVAALFTDQDQVQRVLLVLDRGELRVRQGPYSDALIRVDTPSGSGTLGDPGDTRSRPDATWIVGTEQRGSTVTFLVHGGMATFVNGRSQVQIYAGQRLTVYGNQDALQRVADFNAFALDAFDLWADELVKARPGPSAAQVPPELRYYADDLDTSGTWSYVDECESTCWVPSGVPEDWRPYSDGDWAACDGGLTWVGAEPWAFLTFHFGRWGWGRGLGWYWIPGSAYSPAWVAWNCTGGYFGWAPLGWRNRPCRWGYGPWAGGECWNAVAMSFTPGRGLHGHLSSDPGVLRGFTTWSRGRMMVGNAEFHDPAKFQHVLTQPGLRQQRVAAYARAAQAATGRTFVGPGSGALPYNRQERLEAEHPLLRAQPQRAFGSTPQGGQAPADASRGRTPHANAGGGNPPNGARSAPYEPRPAETRRSEPRPAESHPTEYRPAPRPPSAEPTHAAPAHAEPAHPEPAHAEPAHTEPAHAEPARQQPAHVERREPAPPERKEAPVKK